LSEAFVSGYCTTYRDRRDIDVKGEIIAARFDETGKAYVYFFGERDSSIWFAGPYKPSEGHYYDTGAGVPIDKLFGKAPVPAPKTNSEQR
jgi:hypothetical protein